MRKNLFIALTFACLALAGCVDGVSGWMGDAGEIRFSASTHYDNGGGVETKTVYSGQQYTVGMSKYERIDWVAGVDVIRIYSREAVGQGTWKHADYRIKTVASPTDNYSTATELDPLPGGLAWGTGEHHFYGIYPSPNQDNGKRKPKLAITSVDGENVVEIDVTGESAESGDYGIPPEQGGDWGTWDSTNREYLPNMNYAAMVAYAAATMPDPPATGIGLDFTPLFTAFRVEMRGSDQDPLTTGEDLVGIRLISNRHTLTGDYRVKLGGGSPGNSPMFETIFKNEGREINIDLTGKNVRLSTTESTKVTFLCVPTTQTELTLWLDFASGEHRELELKLNSAPHPWISLEARKKSFLTQLDICKSYTFEVDLNLTGNGEEHSVISDPIFPLEGGLYTNYVTVKSSFGTSTPMAWHVSHYSTDGGSTWQELTVSHPWFSTFTYAAASPSGTETTFDVAMTANASSGWVWPRPSTWAERQSLNTVTSGVGSSGGHDAEGAVDLSYRDVYGQARAEQITANCYVVSGLGWYKLPLVYGNAINQKKVPGGNNTAAYNGSGTGNVLKGGFLNHLGAPITAPWIKDNSITVTGVKVLWQDHPFLIETASAEAPKIEGDYLYFCVDEHITEGNAVIAATDGNDDIVWSWHIWVVNLEDVNHELRTKEVRTVQHSWEKPWTFTYNVSYNGTVYNKSEIVNQMLEINLGYSKGTGVSAYPRDIRLRFVQDESGLTDEVTINQSGSVSGASCPYYQWGRKDPLFGSRVDPSSGEVRNANIYDANGQAIINATDNTAANYYKSTLPDNLKSQAGSIAMSIRHPDWFFQSANAREKSWYSPDGSAIYFNLWNTNVQEQSQIRGYNDPGDTHDLRVEKTIYDPCPPGFKMPNEFAFAGFNSTGGDSDEWNKEMVNARNAKWNTDYGYNFRCIPSELKSETIFFPACGRRHIDSGNLSNVPTGPGTGQGYYWTSAPFNPYAITDGGWIYGRFMYFKKDFVTGVYGSKPLSREELGLRVGWGFPVRPVVDD